jgi:hypothetical protein
MEQSLELQIRERAYEIWNAGALRVMRTNIG